MLKWNSKYSAVLVISLLIALAMFMASFQWAHILPHA